MSASDRSGSRGRASRGRSCRLSRRACGARCSNRALSKVLRLAMARKLRAQRQKPQRCRERSPRFRGRSLCCSEQRPLEDVPQQPARWDEPRRASGWNRDAILGLELHFFVFVGFMSVIEHFEVQSGSVVRRVRSAPLVSIFAAPEDSNAPRSHVCIVRIVNGEHTRAEALK